LVGVVGAWRSYGLELVIDEIRSRSEWLELAGAGVDEIRSSSD